MKNLTAVHALSESQKRRRGHAFNPPKAERVKTPPIGATEGTPLEEKVVHAHYFGPSQDWFVVEANWQTGEAFGYVDLGLGSGEWGYFDLNEIEGIAPDPRAGRFLPMERDCHWTPKPAARVHRIT